MADKLLVLSVRGKARRWEFVFRGDPAHIPEWRSDGLVVCEVVNVVPEWIANLGLTRLWCFLQDVLNFRWPFG